SLAIYRALEDRWGRARCLTSLAHLSWIEEDYGAARALAEESLALSRELGPGSLSLTLLARLARDEGDYAHARGHVTEAREIGHKVGNRRSVALSLESFAALAAAQDQQERAARLLGAADALREAIRLPALSSYERRIIDRKIAPVLAVLDEGAFAA